MLFMILTVLAGCVPPLLYAALFTFGTYALSEELAKFYMFRRRLKILDAEHSWLDLIVYATIVGIGFGILESIVFVATSGPFDMLLRGITIPHGVFLAFLIHGLYDFSLRDELQAVSLDLAAAIAFPVVLLDVILIIVLIVFARRHKNDPKYTTPLKEAPPQLRSKGLSEEQIAQKMHTLRRELGRQYKEAAPPGARTIVRRWLL